jgi:NAD(P)H-hydrate epimerase
MHEQQAIQHFDASITQVQSVVVGPGMGGGQSVARLSVRAVQQEEVPAVVDADALNALAALPDFAREVRGRVIVTPHPGEFRRLAISLGIRHDPVDTTQRESAASELAQRLGCIVVLKGANTVVSDGYRSWVCSHGHPCLATGGTGDILAGLLGGLLAQYSPPAFIMPGQPAPALGLFELACIAVETHARAGEEWAKLSRASTGLTPLELAALIPSVLESMRVNSDATD